MRRPTTARTPPTASSAFGPRWATAADHRFPTATRGSRPSAPPRVRRTLKRSRRVVVAAREVRVVALVECDRKFGVLAIHRIGVGVRAGREDRAIRPSVAPLSARAGEPPQITQAMPGRKQPEGTLAEQQVFSADLRAWIGARREAEAAA